MFVLELLFKLQFEPKILIEGYENLTNRQINL